jgi:hypothetical protein
MQEAIRLGRPYWRRAFETRSGAFPENHQVFWVEGFTSIFQIAAMHQTAFPGYLQSGGNRSLKSVSPATTDAAARARNDAGVT